MTSMRLLGSCQLIFDLEWLEFVLLASSSPQMFVVISVMCLQWAMSGFFVSSDFEAIQNFILFFFYFRLIFYSLRFAFDFLFKLPVLESFALLIFEFSFSLDFGIHSKALKSLSALINYGNSTEGKEIKHRTSRVRGTLYKTIQCQKPKIPG